jgi:hypothetical protein
MAKEYIKGSTCGLKVGNRFLTILLWISIASEPSNSLDGLTLRQSRQLSGFSKGLFVRHPDQTMW